MIEEKFGDCPAFPTKIDWGPEGGIGFEGEPAGEPQTSTFYSGLMARDYAAIHLRVPNSSKPWLDAMIRTSLRNEIEMRAIQALANSTAISNKEIVRIARNIAKEAIR